MLHAIDDHPHPPAQVLADHLGHDKNWLKIEIRQSKDLGPTLSEKVDINSRHADDPGYAASRDRISNPFFSPP